MSKFELFIWKLNYCSKYLKDEMKLYVLACKCHIKRKRNIVQILQRLLKPSWVWIRKVHNRCKLFNVQYWLNMHFCYFYCPSILSFEEQTCR